VIDLLIQSKKLICGHNMFLDIAHTLEKFDRPLPELSDYFKDTLREHFPKYDFLQIHVS
jgi:poly(A)-specific ribonuclease